MVARGLCSPLSFLWRCRGNSREPEAWAVRGFRPVRRGAVWRRGSIPARRRTPRICSLHLKALFVFSAFSIQGSGKNSKKKHFGVYAMGAVYFY